MVDFNRKTDFHYFQGKASWARVHDPDREYNCWSVKLHLTPESYDKFMKLKEGSEKVDGIKNEVKMDDDGRYVTLKRPVWKEWKGVRRDLTAPVVLDKNNQITKEEIGNGSDITVKVECYRYKPPFSQKLGTAIRMVGVKVDNLVPYTDASYTEDKEAAIHGFDQQPAQLF